MGGGILWSFLGNGIFAISQWLLIVVLARVGSTETVGAFAFALAVTAPIFMFTNLGLRIVQATDSRREWVFGVYLWSRICSSTLGFVLVLITAIIWWDQQDRLSIVIAVAAYKVFESLSDIYYGLYQQQHRNDLIAISLGGGGILTLAALGTAFVITGSLLVSCAAMAAAKLMVLLFFDVKRGARLSILKEDQFHAASTSSTSSDISALLRLAWPLGLVALLGSLATNVPRYAVQDVAGQHALGIFAGLSYVLFAGMAVARSVLHPYMPLIAREFTAGGATRFYRVLGGTTLAAGSVGTLGVLIAYVAGDVVLVFFYGPDYRGFRTEFIWMMGAAVFAYMGLGLQYGLTAMRANRAQAVLIGAETLIVLSIAWAFVRAFGVLGGVLATFVGSVFEVIAGACLVWHLTQNQQHFARHEK